MAEGVETESQVAQVRAMDCDFAQGYFIAHPLDAAALRALLKQRPGLVGGFPRTSSRS